MHDHGRYEFTIDGAPHHAHEHRLSGRRLREIAGLEPAEDHVLVLIAHRSAQSVGLDREIELHEERPATFRSFLSDRTWDFTVDGHGFEWGADRVSEADVRSAAMVPEEDEIILEGETPVVVRHGGHIDLRPHGVERLVTRRRPPAILTIIVNARSHQVPSGQIGFEQLIALAFNPVPSGPNVSFTVLYRKGPHDRPEGSVVAGQTVHVREGEVFNVRFTDKS